jgi:hypothetical protein
LAGYLKEPTMKPVLFLAFLFSSIVASAQSAVSDKPFIMFYYASGLVIDKKGNLFMTGKNNKIVKITPDGVASDFAGNPRGSAGQNDGIGTNAKFDDTRDIAIDSADNMYIIGYRNIKKVTPAGVVTTIPDMLFWNARNIAVNAEGTIIYITEEINDKILKKNYTVVRKIEGRVITTIKKAKGSNEDLEITCADGLTCDKYGNLYISDHCGRCIKMVAPDGEVSVVAGKCNKRKFNPVYKEGDLSVAELMTPSDLLIDRDGSIIFSDPRANRVIKIANNKVTTLAGASPFHDGNIGGGSDEGYQDGKAKQALFDGPQSVVQDKAGNYFVVDQGNKCIRKVTKEGMVSTFFK